MKLINCKTPNCPCKVNSDSSTGLCYFCRSKEKREADIAREKARKYCLTCHSPLKSHNQSGYCFRCLKSVGRTRKIHAGFSKYSFYQEQLEKSKGLIDLKEHIRLRDKHCG
jgi:hypothetical protein